MALWGGRFSSETDKELTEFSESVSYDKRLYKYDVLGSKTHVAMLAAQGIIPKETAEAIAVELDVIEKRIDAGDFELKAELEDIHMHIENALIEKLGDEGARVHSARSRNDQVALDIRLYLRDEITNIAEGVKEFQQALVDQADRNGDAILPGFTHLQHAQPVLFGHHLLAYVEMFARDIERLLDCRKRVNVMPLGSGALAGTTLPINREMVCESLKFERVTRNSMDAVADRDFAIELLSALSIFAMHVSRLSEDLILWCSQEFSFVELGDAFCTGSSLMPQKKNPDIAELSRGKTARVYGSLMSLLTLCKGLPLTYNRDMQEDKEPLFDAIDTVNKILRVYPPMVAGLEICRENMFSAASDPALMATDLAEELVKLGVPFRTAHHRVGSFVKWCRDNGKALDAATLDEMRETIPEATPEFLDLFSPESSVAKREVTGATGPKAVADQIAFWKEKLT
ncbi:MAG: argininosuccinate lyase [Lentisphaerae bacterium]|nr:argininosuccinate lyase [Lentisphaerota bacterium]MCP4102301.1 argininosuccinate lyase [Lentisphaerota bacterium]